MKKMFAFNFIKTEGSLFVNKVDGIYIVDEYGITLYSENMLKEPCYQLALDIISLIYKNVCLV